MRSPHPESRSASRAGRWLLPAALLALAPKCVACVLAYVGLGAALGLGGPELCGGAADSAVWWPAALAWLGGGGALVALSRRASRRCE